jgi:coronin-1B/1C/6
LATSADDGVVKLFTIPQNTTGTTNQIQCNKLTENISSATASLSGHRKRVDSIRFHPTANNVIASGFCEFHRNFSLFIGSTDKTLRIWDIEAGKEKFTLDGQHGDGIHSIDWNWDGSLIATVAKDKKVRIIDPRANQVVQVTPPKYPRLTLDWRRSSRSESKQSRLVR